MILEISNQTGPRLSIPLIPFLGIVDVIWNCEYTLCKILHWISRLRVTKMFEFDSTQTHSAPEKSDVKWVLHTLAHI